MPQMTPAELVAAGEAVFGPRWMRPLAWAIGWSPRALSHQASSGCSALRPHRPKAFESHSLAHARQPIEASKNLLMRQSQPDGVPYHIGWEVVTDVRDR